MPALQQAEVALDPGRERPSLPDDPGQTAQGLGKGSPHLPLQRSLPDEPSTRPRMCQMPPSLETVTSFTDGGAGAGSAGVAVWRE